MDNERQQQKQLQEAVDDVEGAASTYKRCDVGVLYFLEIHEIAPGIDDSNRHVPIVFSRFRNRRGGYRSFPDEVSSLLSNIVNEISEPVSPY